MRLIDADALADALFEQRKTYPQWVADTIGSMPVVNVVRCKDCKHYDETQRGKPRKEDKRYPCDDFNPEDDWFCADGEGR